MDVSISVILGAFAGGAVLGVIFFGGLQLTVRRLVTTQRPALLALASFFVRTAVVVGGFVVLGGHAWHRYGAALAGFVAARAVLVRRLGRAPDDTAATGDANGHE